MPGTPSDVQESCDQYVNLASFIARCNSAGLLGDAEGYEYKCGNADIAEEIGDEFPRGNTRNGRILALANYILLAGSGIRDYYYRDPPDSDWGKRARHIWNRWKKKFEAIANGPDEDPKVKDAAKKAHGIMVEFDA